MFTCRVALAQQVAMRIFNGSFEEWYVNNGIPWLEPNVMIFQEPIYGDTLYHWFSRTNVVWIQDGECKNSEYGNFAVDTSIKPVLDKNYVCFNEGKSGNLINYSVGNVSQKLKCNLHKGIKYKMFLYATVDSLALIERIINPASADCEYDTIHNNPVPSLSVLLGTIELVYDFTDWETRKTNSESQFILNQEKLTQKVWRKIEIEFIPEKDFDLISFAALHDPCVPCLNGVSNFGWETLILDAVSDIYYAEPTFVLPPNDTILLGECFEADPYNIHPNPAEHQWEIMGSDSVFFTGGNPQLCPTQTTSYIVRSHDDCGWAVADTLTLFVKPQPDKPPMPTSDLVIFPNPGTSDGMMHVKSSDTGRIHLFDAAGKVVGAFTLVEGEQTIPVNLARGIYFYQAAFSNQSRKHGKYLVANN